MPFNARMTYINTTYSRGSNREQTLQPSRTFPMDVEEPAMSTPARMNTETLCKLLVTTNYLNVLAEPKKRQIEEAY